MAEKTLYKNANEFSQYIEQTAVDEGVTCVQSLIDYCDENDFEFEEIAKIVSKPLKEKLQLEFAEMGMLRASPSLYEVEE